MEVSKPTCDKPKASGRRPESERSERASEASSTQAKCIRPELFTCRRPLSVFNPSVPSFGIIDAPGLKGWGKSKKGFKGRFVGQS